MLGRKKERREERDEGKVLAGRYEQLYPQLPRIQSSGEPTFTK
jgi:hypothetical protein